MREISHALVHFLNSDSRLRLNPESQNPILVSCVWWSLLHSGHRSFCRMLDWKLSPNRSGIKEWHHQQRLYTHTTYSIRPSEILINETILETFKRNVRGKGTGQYKV